MPIFITHRPAKRHNEEECTEGKVGAGDTAEQDLYRALPEESEIDGKHPY